MTRSLLSVLTLLPVLVLAVAGAQETAVNPNKPKFQILDGSPRTIVCITNSHGGGRMLDQKLKRYFGGKSPITVRFVGGWSTPVDPKTGATEPGSWLARFSLEKEKALGHPVVVIALSGV